MNVIMIMLDNFRADHVGINGNTWIKTPSIDELGKESVRFTKAFPDCLPTIPVRRAIYTGTVRRSLYLVTRFSQTSRPWRLSGSSVWRHRELDPGSMQNGRRIKG
jgi:arylsulfatase A-like enzyme